MSFCNAVAMLVRLSIWLDKDSRPGGIRVRAVDPLVTVCSGASASLAACAGILCSACMVADCGGAFSPNIFCGGLRTMGRIIGVKLGPRVGDAFLSFGSCSRLVRSIMGSVVLDGVEGRSGFSGDLVGDAGLECCPFSKSRPKSRTEPA